MKLSTFKNHLQTAGKVDFQLESGIAVPEHFHVTEVGVVSKHFIDCGGVVRNEKVANFQLWHANDTDHRLKAQKLLKIIALSEEVLGMEDLEIEVEYQADTIGKYDVGFDEKHFVLLSKKTACLAADACGIPQEKVSINIKDLNKPNTCTPGGGCC